ncbi:P-loop NTPase family protein [Nakamurella alba]|uniref:hypothetical protein n=1 Tax=Nakamurella alba TaxID=2665158 RepID=UPI0018A906E0|nr:hypothetical protein [Nakamurella alba]
MPARRIKITGISGSGKTTLARQLSVTLGVPWIELDALHHGPDWTPADPDDFRAEVLVLTDGPGWVVDGNYRTHLAGIIDDRVDLLVALDLPRPVVLVQLLARTLRRMATREELWNGNTERWRNLLCTDPEQNILLWAHVHFGAQRRRAREAERAWLSDRTGTPVVRLSSRAQTQRFVEHLAGL